MTYDTASYADLSSAQAELLRRLSTIQPAPSSYPPPPRTPPRIELPAETASRQATRHADRADDEAHKSTDDPDYRGPDGILYAILALAAEVRALRYTLMEK